MIIPVLLVLLRTFALSDPIYGVEPDLIKRVTTNDRAQSS